jgi:hypothetical protein
MHEESMDDRSATTRLQTETETSLHCILVSKADWHSLETHLASDSSLHRIIRVVFANLISIYHDQRNLGGKANYLCKITYFASYILQSCSLNYTTIDHDYDRKRLQIQRCNSNYLVPFLNEFSLVHFQKIILYSICNRKMMVFKRTSYRANFSFVLHFDEFVDWTTLLKLQCTLLLLPKSWLSASIIYKWAMEELIIKKENTQ